MITTTRTRLLTYTAFALTSGFAFASPAQAACTLAAGVLTCTNTTTVDTDYPTNSATGTDRRYNDDGVTSATVGAGVTINGYGLGIATASGTLAVVNNGTIQVDTGLVPLVQYDGQGALYMATNNAAMTYSGTGNIINLGTGEGFYGRMYTGGSLTATFGGSVRADAGDAIRVFSDAGTASAISITTTAGQTIRASGGDGIEIDTNGTGNVTVTNAAAISSGGAGANTLQDGINVNHSGAAGNISIANTGAIGSATDRAQLTGITAASTNAGSNGTTSITGSGAIWSVGDGINASSAGSGTVTVNYTGAINSTTGEAIEVDTVDANISVTTGAGAITTTGNAAAIDARSTGSGNVSVTTGAGAVTSNTVAGNSAIISVAATGTNSVTTGTGAVTGSANGIQILSTGLAPAAQTVTVGGVVTGVTGSGITSTTAGPRTISVLAAGNVTGGTQAIELLGAGATTITNAGTIGSASTGLAINAATAGAVTLTNSATGIINGRFTLSAGDDTVTNSGTMNVQGALDFGAGTDRFVNAATGIINLTGNTSLVGLENLGTGTTQANAGRINLGTFTLTGPAILLTNSGTITTTGSAGLAGFTAFTNSGTLTLGGGTFTAPAGVFTNSGTVSAITGANTITGQSSFVNAGGIITLNDADVTDTLTINSNYSASGNARLALNITQTSADRLVINGNVSGVTNVQLTPIGAITGINNTGILIVDVTGTSTANAFTTTSAANSVLNYAIEQRGVDYFVITIPNSAAFTPVLIGNLVQDSWYQGAEAFNAMAQAAGGEKKESGFAIWLQPYYQTAEYGDDTHTFTALGRSYTIDSGMETNGMGIQGGVDFNAGMADVGVTVGYHQNEQSAGAKINGWNIGAYAMAGAPAGFYGNALVKYDSNNIDLDFGPFVGSALDTDSTAFGVDGEVGFRSTGSIGFDVNAGLAYVSADIDEYGFSGIDYEYDSVTSLRGRIGARAVFHEMSKIFVGGKLMHEFDGDTDLALNSVTSTGVGLSGRGTWVRAEVGLGGGRDTPVLLQAWGDFGDTKGFGARAGFRF